MTTRKNKLKQISITLLVLVSLFFGLKYYKTSSDFKTFKKNAELENEILESQLFEILHKYDSVSLNNKIDGTDLNDLKATKNSGFIKKSAEFDTNEDSVLFYKDNSSQLKKKRLKYGKFTRNKASSKLRQLNVLNINVKGVKIFSESYNQSDIKIQQLRVCFSIEENHFAKAEEKKIYVQVVNPKNQIISSGNTFIESNNQIKLQYSAAVNATYKNAETDVCTYVNLEPKKTIKGKYQINIYHDFVKIGSTIFEY